MGNAKAVKLLFIGYALGQGSVFIAQLFLKIQGKQIELGLAVLAVSALSLCLQFGEFGNSTFLIRAIVESRLEQARAFLRMRTAVAIAVTIISVPLGFGFTETGLSTTTFIILLLIAAASGFGCMPTYEARNKYGELAIAQAAPWILMGITIAAASFLGFTVVDALAIVVLVAVGSTSILTRVNLAKQAGAQDGSSAPSSSRYFALGYILPPLMSQIYGRAVVFGIASFGGLAMAGDLGLVKYMQVALTVTVGFVLRPMHRELNIQLSKNSVRENPDLRPFKPVLIFSAAGAIATLVIGAVAIEGAPWYLVIAGLPFWVAGGVASIINASRFGSAKFLKIELTGLSINAIFFVSLVGYYPIVAIVLGEVAQQVYVVARCWALHLSAHKG